MFKYLAVLMLSFFYCLSLMGCDGTKVYSSPAKIKQQKKKKPVAKRNKLEQVKHDGVLRVLTRVSPNTYYPKGQGYAGLEYDLVTLFAKELGVKVEFHTAQNLSDVIEKTAHGEFDLAAAGIALTKSREEKLRFGSAYHEIVEQVLYKSGTVRPKTPHDLNNGILEVVKDSSHIESLRHLRDTVLPELSWTENPEQDSNQLIELVEQGLIDYTVADSTQVLLLQRFYPKLQVAFDISAPRNIAWGLPKSTDNSLFDAVNHFFAKIKQDKTLDQLLDRHYGHIEALDYVDKCKFYQHQQDRLPLYKPYFIEAAGKYNLDWRLLAAVGYQESHWQNSAVSPTGVRGIMMLTTDTALQVGIEDRTNPLQSIEGGALYFQQQLKKIPPQIPEPDRTWFALAAYNIGYGHLEDARILARQQNKNPDKWLDVKQVLPLLTQEEWHIQTKHGYARGYEPVIYVENIRNYYDLLVWLTREMPEKNQLAKKMLQNTDSSADNQWEFISQKISDFFNQTKNWLDNQFKALTA
jgi:membrane-bound lytic murein transglycosylase F